MSTNFLCHLSRSFFTRHGNFVFNKNSTMIFDTASLLLDNTIINQPDAQLFSYTHETGALILSATLYQPRGQVFFETDDTHLHLFYTDKISLQELFEATIQSIVTVEEDCECKLYMRSDVAILLSGGEKSFSQLIKN
jgi:hypothetical protein